MSFMKSPAFQFYPSDWLGSRAVRLMDAEQRGWYIQLLAEAWQSRPQATLPNDPALLIRLADANQESTDFAARWAFVVSQFKLKGELLVNARLAHEKRKQNDYHQQRKEAGTKGAKTRWRKAVDSKGDTAKVGHSLAIAEPSLSHTPAIVSPMAKNSLSSSSSSSPSSSSSKEKDPADAGRGVFTKFADLVEFRGWERKDANSFIGGCLKTHSKADVESAVAQAIGADAQDPKAYVMSLLNGTGRKHISQAEMNRGGTGKVVL